jgi:hypothetical protein
LSRPLASDSDGGPSRIVSAELLARERLPFHDDPGIAFEVEVFGERAWFEARFPTLFEGPEGCAGSEFEPSSEAEVIEVDANTRLVLFLCEPGAYNLYYVSFLAALDHSEWRWSIVPAALCGDSASRIVNPRWEAESQTLTFFEKGVGDGGCGVQGAVEWDGERLDGGWCRAWSECEHPSDDEWPLMYGEEVSRFLPPAFTAEELAAGIEAGEHYVFQVDTREGSSQTHVTFSDAGPETVNVVSWAVVEGVATEPVTAAASWDELATHSLYPENRATRRETMCSTAIGELAGTEYEVREDDGSIVRACFATELPGPPVRYLLEVDEVAVFGMVLIAHELSPAAP